MVVLQAGAGRGLWEGFRQAFRMGDVDFFMLLVLIGLGVGIYYVWQNRGRR
ncbi:MAG TPA: hypothetical protein VGA08_03790 [Candidatus Saccharimonadales bacterium]